MSLPDRKGCVRLGCMRPNTAFSPMNLRALQGLAAAPSAGQIVNDRVTALVAVNTALYDALARFNASANSTDNERMTYEVEAWHTNALKWMESATEASQDPTKFAGWRKWGLTLARDADGIFGRLNNSTWTNYLLNFAKTFPSAVGTAVKIPVTGVLNVAQDVAEGTGKAAAKASKGLGISLLWIGLPLAAILVFATMGGRSIGVGPVRVGGGRVNGLKGTEEFNWRSRTRRPARSGASRRRKRQSDAKEMARIRAKHDAVVPYVIDAAASVDSRKRSRGEGWKRSR